MVDVDGVHACDEILAGTMKELLDDVEKRHRVPAARERHNHAHGIEGLERKLVAFHAQKRLRRTRKRFRNELRQAFGERL